MTRVRFADQPKVKLVRNVTKYKKDLWFTKEEFDSFIYQAQLQARDLTPAVLYREETTDFLGLECYLTPSTAREIMRRKRFLVNAILFTQRRQRLAGVRDPGELARISQVLSKCSATRARCIGMVHDERNAQVITIYDLALAGVSDADEARA